MTKIDENLISKLEHLSKLKLGEDEKVQITSDLNAIVKMFDKLQEVDTTDVEPLRHISEMYNQLREDKVSGELDPSEALSNVKSKKDGFITVPNFLKPKE